MTPREIILAKAALRCLDDAGGAGLSSSALLEQTAAQAETMITSLESRALLGLLTEKEWIYQYKDPLTGNKRWVITEAGHLAKSAL